MKKLDLRFMFILVFGAVSISAKATGLIQIPLSGFSGSAYTLCNTTGNFGSGIVFGPSANANNTCAVFPANDAVAPVGGYTLIASATRNASEHA